MVIDFNRFSARPADRPPLSDTEDDCDDIMTSSDKTSSTFSHEAWRNVAARPEHTDMIELMVACLSTFTTASSSTSISLCTFIPSRPIAWIPTQVLKE
jgi:hypothetical protein